jgi:hypothetical protein
MTGTIANMGRRTFLAAAGMTALAQWRSLSASSNSSSTPLQLTGNGEWTYAVVPNWGALPAGTSFGGTHGAIAQDKAGNIYVSTQSHTGVLVYGSDGRLLRKIATAYPGIHSLFFATEGAKKFYTSRCRKVLLRRTGSS